MSDFLNTVSEDDLKLLESAVWEKGQRVTFGVDRINEIRKTADGGPSVTLALNVKAVDSVHEGRETTIYVTDRFKDNYIALLGSLFTKDELINKTATLDKVVGKKITAIAGEPKVIDGNVHQNWFRFQCAGAGAHGSQV